MKDFLSDFFSLYMSTGRPRTQTLNPRLGKKEGRKEGREEGRKDRSLALNPFMSKRGDRVTFAQVKIEYYNERPPRLEALSGLSSLPASEQANERSRVMGVRGNHNFGRNPSSILVST